MLARVQSQAPKQCLPSVCTICRLRWLSARHYKTRTASQTNLGRIRPTSKEGHLGRYIERVKRNVHIFGQQDGGKDDGLRNGGGVGASPGQTKVEKVARKRTKVRVNGQDLENSGLQISTDEQGEDSIGAASSKETHKPNVSEKKANKNRKTRQDDSFQGGGHPEMIQSEPSRRQTTETPANDHNNDLPELAGRNAKSGLAPSSTRARRTARRRGPRIGKSGIDTKRLVRYTASSPKSTQRAQTRDTESRRIFLALSFLAKRRARMKNLQRSPQVRWVLSEGKSLKEALMAMDQPGTEMRTSAREMPSKQTKKAARAKKPNAAMIDGVSATDLRITPLDFPRNLAPRLSHGLDRVLFNPGVYHLQDPRSRVYNFDSYLEKIMPAAEFKFEALQDFTPPFQDAVLKRVAREVNIKYFSSTSSLVSVLQHFHYLLSQWRLPILSMLSKGFEEMGTDFTTSQKAPASVFVRYEDGLYAIEADNRHSSPTILSLVGRSMEKLFTHPKFVFEQYRRSNSGAISDESSKEKEAFNYTVFSKILVRSQLDAHDPRLPGTGIFDIKTRAVLPVRMDAGARGGVYTNYQIRTDLGTFESFEREYFDMIRSTMLKYSLQVRMGRMDGIFVAYHNIERIFGFQYVSRAEMDVALHGQADPTLGNRELNASLNILSVILDRVIERFPKQSFRLLFETRQRKVPFMYIFAEPVSEDKIQEYRDAGRKQEEEMEQSIRNPDPSKASVTTDSNELESGWSDIKEMVREEVNNDDNIQDKELEQSHHQDAISGLEEQIAILRSSVALLKVKSKLFMKGLKLNRADGFEDTLSVFTSSENKQKQLQEILFETEEHIKDRTELQTILDAHETQNEDLQRHVDELRSQLKQLEADIRLQHTANDDMTSRLRDQLDEGLVADELIKGETNDSAGTSPEKTVGQLENSTITHNQKLLTTGPLNIVGGERSSSSSVSSETSQPIEIHAEERANSPSMENLSEPEEPRELLAMTLTIRNKVDNIYVTRPDNLGTDSDWAVEYSIEEIDDNDQAWSRYEGSCERLSKAYLSSDEKRLEGWYNSQYMRKLYELSEKGRLWREEQDRIDERIGKIVFEPNEKPIKSNEREEDNTKPFEGEVGMRDVESYLEWLYRSG